MNDLLLRLSPALAPLGAMRRVHDFLRGKRVLITGVCGTIGRRLSQRLLEEFEIASLVGIDNNETELAFLEEEYKDARVDVKLLLGDVRDQSAVQRVTRGVQVVFHVAAYKHVHVCERSPLEAIHTNVLGVQNVIQSAHDNGVERLVFTSSDKAVNPTNVMGTSKLLGERLIAVAAGNAGPAGGKFVSVRFGNVLGSRGSVIPVFAQQIRKGGPVTLTHSDMTRFIISLDDAIDLVLEATVLANSGDILISKMPALRISDLAHVMIGEYAPELGRSLADIKTAIVGPKPGEKLYEELMNDEETRRSLELEHHYVVRPVLTVHTKSDTRLYDNVLSENVDQSYNSNCVKPMASLEIRDFLRRNKLVPIRTSAGRRESEHNRVREIAL